MSLPLSANGSVVLVAITKSRPGPLPAGPLGTPRLIDTSRSSGGFVVVVETDVDWSTAPTESLEWLAPRAIHFDDLARACTSAGVLPFRFGIAFSSEHDLLAHLDSRSVAIQRELDRLDGRHEYRVGVSIDRSDPSASASGADYLRRRRSEIRDGRTELDELRHDLESASSAVHYTSIAEAQMSVAVLCGADEWAEVSAVLRRSTATVEYEGPLPPYHFVALDE